MRGRPSMMIGIDIANIRSREDIFGRGTFPSHETPPMDDLPPPSFHAADHKSAAAAGLGKQGARAWLIGEALVLTGADQARLDLPFASIKRIRVGAYDNRFAGKLYQMMLWAAAIDGPITLSASKRDEADFAVIARAIGAAIEARGGTIESGLSWLTALALPLWMLGGGSVLTALQIPHALQEHSDSALATIGGMAAVILPVTAILFGLFTWRTMPRTLVGADEMQPYLPDGERTG